MANKVLYMVRIKQIIMGHSSVSVTEIYANLVNKKRDEVADIMNFEITHEDIERKEKRNKN